MHCSTISVSVHVLVSSWDISTAAAVKVCWTLILSCVSCCLLKCTTGLMYCTFQWMVFHSQLTAVKSSHFSLHQSSVPFLVSRVSMSLENLMLVCLQKDVKQCYDVTTFDCSLCSGCNCSVCNQNIECNLTLWRHSIISHLFETNMNSHGPFGVL